MGYGQTLMNMGKGSTAIAVSDLIVFKGLPMLPATVPGVSFIQNNPLAVRLLLCGASIFAAEKYKSMAIPFLVSASHNLNAGVYTIQKVHDFIGIHSQIDEVASQAVAAIEQGIADEIAKFKETLNDNPLSDNPLSNPLSERMGEEISDYEMVMG